MPGPFIFSGVHPQLVLRNNAWQTFRSDFSRTLMRIKRMSSHIEVEADILRMREDENRYHEVLQLLAAMRADKEKEEEQRHVPYNNIPFSVNPKLNGRQDILETAHNALSPDADSPSTKSIALFGMGGVGKTQVAIQYGYQNLDRFDDVLWVAADNTSTISQSFRVIAEGVGLLKSGEEPKDTVWTVRNWRVHPQQKLSLQDFLPLYEKYSSKIDSRRVSGSDYEYTLSSVWDVSFGKLTEDSIRLLNVVSFFDPDSVPEEILSQGSGGLEDESAFLADENGVGPTSAPLSQPFTDNLASQTTDHSFFSRFSDASEELLCAALVNRTGETAVRTVHRLVQSAARKRLSPKTSSSSSTQHTRRPSGSGSKPTATEPRTRTATCQVSCCALVDQTKPRR